MNAEFNMNKMTVDVLMYLKNYLFLTFVHYYAYVSNNNGLVSAIPTLVSRKTLTETRLAITRAASRALVILILDASLALDCHLALGKRPVPVKGRRAIDDRDDWIRWNQRHEQTVIG